MKMKANNEQIVRAVSSYRTEVARGTMGPSSLRALAQYIDNMLGGNGTRVLAPQSLMIRIEKLIRTGRLYGLRTWDCPSCQASNVVNANVTTDLICLECLERFDPGKIKIRARLLMPSLVVVDDNGHE
jgi:hypothetical protein